MPNLAQEFPLLLVVPMIVFAAISTIAGLIHLSIIIESRGKSRRRVDLRVQGRAHRPAGSKPAPVRTEPAALAGPASLVLVE